MILQVVIKAPKHLGTFVSPYFPCPECGTQIVITQGRITHHGNAPMEVEVVQALVGAPNLNGSLTLRGGYNVLLKDLDAAEKRAKNAELELAAALAIAEEWMKLATSKGRPLLHRLADRLLARQKAT